VDLLRRFQGRKPEETAAAPASPTLILVTPPNASAGTAPQAPSLEKPSPEPALENPSPKPGPAAQPAGKTGADRIAALEARLAAVEAGLAAESEERGRLLVRSAESVAALESRLADGEAGRHAAHQSVEAGLTSLSARAEKLFQDIAALARGVEALEASLQEKTSQGLREAEDIRTQIAPLLEERENGREADRRVLAELDRLRESLADSLAGVSETLRRAVGGI